jgi:K+-sensing histidine kinase KdpD
MFQQLLRPSWPLNWGGLPVILLSLLLLGVLTAALGMLQNFADVGTVTITYLIAVLFAATHGGVFPAIVTAFAAIAAAAFFFYAPIYDFRVYNPVHLIDLVLFVIVAVVTGKLATNARSAKLRANTDALRDALIGSVSHELRTPLASITGSVSILARSPEVSSSGRLQPLVEGMQEEATRLNALIENLLDSTRISSEGIRPHAEWADPGDIVNAAVERRARLLVSRQVRISIDVDLPLVHTDPTLIEKALGHLIENAAKYSPPNSFIDIAARLSGGKLQLTVSDGGAGLTREERALIWERFYRGRRHRSTTTGSGLGLWITRALVEACGGQVDVQSAGIHRGTTVSIALPLSQEVQAREAIDQ